MLTINDNGTGRLAAAEDLKAVLTSLTDPQANALLEQATGLIETACGRVLHQRQLVQTERLKCRTRSLIMLDQWPVTVMTSIVEDGDTLTDGTDFEIDGSFVRRLSGDEEASWPRAKVVLTYTAGYPEDGAPADLKRACIDVAVNLNAVQGRDQTQRSVSIPGVETISFRDHDNGGGIIPESAAAVLDGYREFRI